VRRPADDAAVGTLALPLLSCYPEQLGVLPIAGQTGRPGSSGPTPYLARPLDQELRDAVQGAVNGEPVVISLIGGRSTGKKRAMWELINRCADGQSEPLLADWNVWPGTSPSDPVTLLSQIAKIPPCTVYWLAPAERYFSDEGPKYGNDVALALRRLFGDRRRGPNILLCTFTPQGWQSLVTMPAATDVDKFQQVRMLLLGGAQIVVPDSLTQSEVDCATNLGDPRLADAAARAPGRHAIQYLTAAPWLNIAFSTASPPARAVLKCIIAVRRIGHGRWVPRKLLECGALGFMSHPERAALGDDWLAVALDELTQRGTGGLSLMSDLPAPGHSDDGRGRWFQLDEYVERRWVKNGELSPDADDRLWSALVTAADSDSLLDLANESRERGLLLQSNRFCRRAFEEGVPGAGKALIELFRRPGRIDDALGVYDELIRAGDVEALLDAAEMLISTGRGVDALELLSTDFAEADDRARLLRAMAFTHQKPASAVDHYRELAAGGDVDAACEAADLMVRDSVRTSDRLARAPVGREGGGHPQQGRRADDRSR
jgi:hypothetical protein